MFKSGWGDHIEEEEEEDAGLSQEGAEEEEEFDLISVSVLVGATGKPPKWAK